MSDITREQMELIKKYRFAVLPQRIGKQSEEKDKESVSDKIAVQCQVCGRMGAMNPEEMKKHHEKHEQEKASAQ